MRARPLGSRRLREASFTLGKESRPYSTSVMTPPWLFFSVYSLCPRQAVLPLLVMAAGGGGLLGLFPILCWASFVSVFSKPHQVSSATKALTRSRPVGGCNCGAHADPKMDRVTVRQVGVDGRQERGREAGTGGRWTPFGLPIFPPPPRLG